MILKEMIEPMFKIGADSTERCGDAVNRNTPILEVYKMLSGSANILRNTYYTPRKRIAKNWELTLCDIIKELKECFIEIEENEETKRNGKLIVYHTYNFLQIGKNVKCIDVFRKAGLAEGLKDNEFYNRGLYYDILQGVELAEIIPEMEKELQDLENARKIKTEPIRAGIQKINLTGSKKQLYSAIRQLKEQGVIGNTYDELTDFLHDCVIQFSDSNKGTTARELKKDINLPKGKRINLDTGTED